jgi:Zn-dependent protease
MQGWWVLDAYNISPVYLAAVVFWVIFSICLHELGHGWAAIKQGDRTPIHAGHMTWNPLVHMGPMSLAAFALFGFSWGLMPVDPSRFRSRYGEAIVAAAGPAVNLLLAAFCFAVLAIGANVLKIGSFDPGRLSNVMIFFLVGMQKNIFLAMFNLLPVPPLDGSTIVADFHPPFRRIFQGEHGQIIAVITFVLLFVVAGRYISEASLYTTFWLLMRVV